MTDYTNHKMMKELVKELEGGAVDNKFPKLLSVVKALIFENIDLKDEDSRKEKEKTHGIDVLFKEEEKEEAAEAAAGGATTIISELGDMFQKYNVTGSMKDGRFIADGTPAKHTTGLSNYPDVKIAKGTVFENIPDPEGGMGDPWIWKMLSNRESTRGLEDKVDTLIGVNQTLIKLIKETLL
jgi:hypothetical protein